MEKQANSNRRLVRDLVFFAVLVALVVVLQLFASSIKIGVVTLNFSLVPIVLGAILLGPYYGAGLGALCGVIVFSAGAVGADQFTFVLIGAHPVITFLTCVIKTSAAGLAAGFLFALLSKKNRYAAIFTASAVVPVVNTALFILGALLMSGTLRENFVADGQTVLYFLVIVCAGLNFIFELILNLILAPAISQIVYVVEKGKY